MFSIGNLMFSTMPPVVGWIVDQWGYNDAVCVLLIMAVCSLILSSTILLLNAARGAHLNLAAADLNRYLETVKQSKSTQTGQKQIPTEKGSETPNTPVISDNRATNTLSTYEYQKYNDGRNEIKPLLSKYYERPINGFTIPFTPGFILN